MRRLIAAPGTAAAISVLVALAAGGGYALASSNSKTIHACVHRHGGGLYVAGKCAKRDRRLSWNQVGPSGKQGPAGPQGPGASYLDYSVSGSSSGAPTTIGTLGPFSFSGVCTTNGNTTSSTIYLNEAGAQVDGLIVSGNSARSTSGYLGALSGAVFDTGSSSSGTPETASSDELVLPQSGSAIELQQTFSVTGGAANACHFTATATPTTFAGSTAALKRAAAAPSAATIKPLSSTGGLVVAGERIR